MPNIENHPTGTPNWYDVMTPDEPTRVALMDFYSKVFGWTWDVSDETMGFYSIAQNNSQAVMGIGQGPQGAGVPVVYFACSDVAASADRAEELGGTIVMPPMQVSDVGTMALVLDPTGAIHGLWQAGNFTGFGVVYEANSPGWFDHASADPDSAAAYYQALLGHEIIEPEPGMKVIAAGEQWFASFSTDEIDRGYPQWSAIYVADSLERVRNTVRELGGTILLEEMPVPGSVITVFREPVLNAAITVMQGGEQP